MKKSIFKSVSVIICTLFLLLLTPIIPSQMSQALTLDIPDAPTGITAVSSSYNSINTSWNAVAGVSGYEVYRATSSTGPSTLITAPKGLSFNNTGLTTNTTYYYRVRSYKMNGIVKVRSGYSAMVSAKPIQSLEVLGIPTNLKATSSTGNSINTSWSAVAGASGYEVYRATSSAGPNVLITAPKGLSFNNTGLTTNKTYYYRVRSYKMKGTVKVRSGYSAMVSAKPIQSLEVIGIPTNLKATSSTGTSINTSWSAVAGAIGYEVYRSTSSTGPNTLITAPKGLSFNNTGLITNTFYYYRVRSYKMNGALKVRSGYSSMASAKPLTTPDTQFNQNITLGSTRQHVLTAIGYPIQAYKYADIYFMKYDKGTILLDKDLIKVIGWDNQSIPNLVLGSINSKAPAFKIGSSTIEVGNAMGTPSFVSPHFSDNKNNYWIYHDKSIVFFDINEKVISYVNKGSLKVSLGQKLQTAPPINYKSKIIDVVNAMGTPETVNAYVSTNSYYSQNGAGVKNYMDPFTGSTYLTKFTPDYTYYQYKDSFVAFDKNEKIIHFLNGGTLNVNFGDKDPNFKGLTIYSTEDDIVKAMGTPDKILDNASYKRNWCYGESYISVDETGKIVGWYNKGNLNISENDSVENSPVITIGSTKQDVLNVNGTPNQFFFNQWLYGDSRIYFDSNSKVETIYKTDNIKLSNSKKDILSAGFYVGSSVDDVMKAMGTPDMVELGGYNDNYIAWDYGKDSIGTFPKVSILFDLDGKVVYWNSHYNDSIELKLMIPPQFDPNASPITLGSTKEDVLKVMGTPTSLSAPEAIGGSWSYGTYYIVFDMEDKVVGWSYIESNAKISLGNKVSGATFAFASTKDEVISAMGTPKGIRIEPSYPLVQWFYDDCYIGFDPVTYKVNSWTNASKLMLTKILPDLTAKPFKVDSSQEEVLKVMGTPDTININPPTPGSPDKDYSVWSYGNSTIEFTVDGKVLKWFNNDGNLRTE